MITCKNCSHTFEGNFCPECGQKGSTKRFSLKIVFKELVKKLLPLDQGILFTAKNLLLTPGMMIRDYLDGKRVNYTKPIHFLFFTTALSLLFFSKDQFEAGFNQGLGTEGREEIRHLQQQVLEFVLSHFSLVFILIVPFLAFSNRLFFKKQGFNYAEHLVASCYLMAGASLASMPGVLVVRALDENPYSAFFTGILSILYFAYFVWASLKFLQPRNKWMGSVKTIFSFLLAYASYLLVLILTTALGVAIYVSLWKK